MTPLTSSDALTATDRTWVREPLWIAIAMTSGLGILAPLSVDLPFSAILGLVQLGCLIGALQIGRAGDERFRLLTHCSQGLVFASTAYTVFGVGYPGSMILYSASPVLLCAAHLLGARAAVWWAAPWLCLIVASEFVPGPNSVDADTSTVLFMETSLLVSSVALATSLRRAYDAKARDLEWLARTDALTGLANRRDLMRELESAIERARRYERRGAVLFIDIDGLKRVNDEHGHDTGDALIRSVADGLRRQVRSVDVAARMGGDEFVVLLGEYEDAKGAEGFARKIAYVLSRRVEAIGPTLNPRASIGIAEFPTIAGDAESVLRRADEAMYAAKQAGGDRIRRATTDGVEAID